MPASPQRALAFRPEDDWSTAVRISPAAAGPNGIEMLHAEIEATA
jgi:hypothetical protein